MAANIQILSDGTECYVENGRKERAWHGLGTVYDRPLTALEAIQGAHADFEVVGENMFFMTPEFKNLLAKGEDIPVQTLRELMKKVEGFKCNVRQDLQQSLGVVSDSYAIVQNQHAFDFVDMLTTGTLGGEVPTIESAGVLGNGERIFITAKFPEPIRMAHNDNDLIDMYVVFTTSHDGSGAVTAMVTPIRVVCNNTLNLAMSHFASKLSLRHTVNVGSRLDLSNKENAQMAFRTLKMYDVYKQHFEESLSALKNIRMNDKDIEKCLVVSLLSPDAQKIYKENNFSLQHDDIPTRSKNIIENITNSLHTGVGQDIITPGNGLWLVNGLTTYYQNDAKWTDDEKKFNAIMDGSVQTKLQKVYENVLALAA